MNVTHEYSVDGDFFVKPLALSFTAIQLTYGIPSLTLLVLLLIKLRKYPNSFYRMVQLDLVTNIICYINSWLAVRLYVYRSGVYFLVFLENIIPGMLTLNARLANFFLHMQFCSAISLSLHRISSIKYPNTYDKFWSKYYILYGILCATYSWGVKYTLPGTVSSFEVANRTIKKTIETKYLQSFLLQLAICTVLYFLLIFSVGLFTAYLVSKTIKSVSATDRGIGKKLTKVALTYCFLFSGILLWTVGAVIDGPFKYLPASFSTYYYDTMIFASDLMTLSLPYVMLVYDNNIRRDLFKKSTPTLSPIFVLSNGGTAL